MNTISRTLVIVGVIISTLGLVFSLQSKSVLGPSSSFMYDSSEWTVNGAIIIAIGLVMVTVGGLILLSTNRKIRA
jgi:hypothetical protein